MTVTADFSELHNLAVDFARAGLIVGARTSAVVRKTAFDVEADAQTLAPYDTGNLKGSIGTTITGDGRSTSMTAEIGPTAEYGIYQELGTSRMGPNPYMAPAFDRRVGPFIAALEAASTPDL